MPNSNQGRHHDSTADDAGRNEHLIAVGTDFSPASELARKRAYVMAKGSHARLLLVHVVRESAVVRLESLPGDRGTHVAPAPTVAGTAAAKSVHELAEERIAAEAGGVDAESVVRAGRPHEQLAEVADARRAALLVLGVRRAVGPEESFFLGTTAERAVRHGTTPVLLSRSEVTGPYRKVLAPLEVARTTAGHALRAIRHVAHTMPGSEVDVVQYISPDASHEARSRENREAVPAVLAGLCKEAGLPSSRTRTHVFVADAGHGIVGEVKTRRPDAIVLADHGRAAALRDQLSSVGDYLVEGGPAGPEGAATAVLVRSDAPRPLKSVLVSVEAAARSAGLSLSVLRLLARYVPGADVDVVQYLDPDGPHETKSKEHRDAVSAALFGVCKEAGLDLARTRQHAFVADARPGILAEVKNRRPELVALGTHARSGLSRVLLGSVADFVIHAVAGVDVLAVPHLRE